MRGVSFCSRDRGGRDAQLQFGRWKWEGAENNYIEVLHGLGKQQICTSKKLLPCISFVVNIPELDFILPSLTALHIPHDQREDVLVLQDLALCSRHYFLPIFKPMNCGERVSSNGTGNKDILSRSRCHRSWFANEPGLNTVLRFCSAQMEEQCGIQKK